MYIMKNMSNYYAFCLMLYNILFFLKLSTILIGGYIMNEMEKQLFSEGISEEAKKNFLKFLL